MITHLPTDFQKRPALDPLELLSDNEVEQILEREQAQADGRNGQKDFDEALHPRDDHGRFTDGGGGGGGTAPIAEKPGEQISFPRTTGQVHTAYVNSMEKYLQNREAHGGPPADYLGSRPEDVYAAMNIVEARPQDVPDDQRARCEEAAAKFLNDPEMQPLFAEYGRPEIVVADRIVSAEGQAGEDPANLQVVAQWSNGTIFLYGDTAGNPDTQSTPGYSTAGADPALSLIHEYGHQVGGTLGYDGDGNPSAFRQSFVEALGGGPIPDWRSTQQEKADFSANVDLNAGQVSEYATSTPDEAFVEFFTALYQLQKAGEDIEATYDGGAAEAVHIIQDQNAKDIGTDPNQQTLFTRTNS